MDKAKHAYGSRKNLEAAIASGKVDAYDLLFLNGDGETPAIGWVDKNGNPIVIAPTDDLAELETKVNDELSEKANVSDVETSLSAKADVSDVEELEKEVATKVDVATVETMIKEATSATIEVIEF